MNVFEDLVVELQEENLLEKTSIRVDVNDFSEFDDLGGVAISNGKGTFAGACSDRIATVPEKEQFGSEEENNNHLTHDNRQDSSEQRVNTVVEPTFSEVETVEIEDNTALPENDPPLPKKPKNGKEFYRKRAVGEVSNLQMVEHVLTGVEREYMKVLPNAFDDFNVKKSLHAFLQIDENENTAAHQEAEFTLMQETEAWCTALAVRDQKVPVSALRQYCENSRPALSSQAMLAIARFYRNLPYSESVRSKFDFMITRLFSRSADHDKRLCLFNREETLTHVNTLYREWSSISLYAAEDDDTKVTLAALSFDDLAVESEQVSNFDQLIASDFFTRLRTFKESIAELFYAPNVTAAAIEANIRIGNSYVELIKREREKMDAKSIHSKYGDLNDQTVSDAAGRTLDLVDLLRVRPVEGEYEAAEPEPEREVRVRPSRPTVVANTKEEKQRSEFIADFIENARNVNRWFLVFSLLLILGSVGIFVWATFFVTEDVPTSSVKTVATGNPALDEVTKTARVSGENFYILLKANWNTFPKEKRQDYLLKAFEAAKRNGCKQVSLITHEGKPAAFASASRNEVMMP